MGTDNLHHKRKARQTKDIERQKAQREPYDRVLIVCEDSKSSPAYLRAVCDELKLSTANIEIKGEECDSAPISVVEYAIKLIKKDKGYDQIYCVIDRDQHKRFQEALEKAKGKKIKMIVSIPCFEYWLLLHFKFTSEVFQAATGSHCQTVISTLKQHLSGYDKSELTKYYPLLKPKQEVAIKHAKQRESACEHEPLEQRNPYTQLHLLIECLKHLKDEKQSKEKCSVAKNRD
jgi:hypothetical protein